MCGTWGFFVGCEMAGECLKGKSACSLISNQNAMRDWYGKARVRHSKQHILNEDDINGHIFPVALAPVTNHSLVQALDGERVMGILNNHLFRYLDFTIKLEMAVVNDVVRDMAFKHLPILPDADMVLDAHKIYTDEAFHAQFSAELMHQAQSLLKVDPVLPEAPQFLHELQRSVFEAGDERQKRLRKLFFVIVSETLITSSLTDIRQDSGVPVVIREAITDHALDEARHHAFFSGFLVSIWDQLSRDDRLMCLTLIPEFVLAFVEPDRAAISKELHTFGLSLSDAEIVIEETYPKSVVEAYARNCASSLMSVLKLLPEFKEAVVQDAFVRFGLLDDCPL